MACVQAAPPSADSWRELIDLIKASREQIGKRAARRPTGPVDPVDAAGPRPDPDLAEIIRHLKSPKPSKAHVAAPPEWSRLTQEARTDHGELKEVEHFEAVLHSSKSADARNLCKRWDRQMEGLAAPRAQTWAQARRDHGAYGGQLEKAVTGWRSTGDGSRPRWPTSG